MPSDPLILEIREYMIRLYKHSLEDGSPDATYVLQKLANCTALRPVMLDFARMTADWMR